VARGRTLDVVVRLGQGSKSTVPTSLARQLVYLELQAFSLELNVTSGPVAMPIIGTTRFGVVELKAEVDGQGEG